MILTIDIGNSTTKFGFFKGEELVNKIIIETDPKESVNSIYRQFNRKPLADLSAVVISTVVRELKNTYQSLFETQFNLNPFFADHTFDYGFEIKYFPPENCGSDRLVDAFAAVEKYRTPLIVCDFGTATTIDIVNSKNQYMGGIITPGPNTLGSALFEKTSKLPKIDFAKPKNVIGDSTVSSIQSGLYYGYIGLVDGIIEKMLNELKEDEIRVISTGGFARSIADESKYVDIIEEDLMLEGLRLVHEKLNGD